MTNASNCPSCGNLLPSNAPSGICPACLMQAGMDQLQPTVTPISDHSFVPPDVSTLASQFSQLEILQLIGCGGMGAVYKARQTKLDRTVALKVLRPETSNDAAFAQRFNREARTLARLSHPNIVGVHDFGEITVPDDNGHPRTLFYFVMEYVDGADLRQLMGSEMSPPEALSIISQVCCALQYAHEEGIVHRDIKPENILLDAHGKVKIADFGLAKLATKTEHEYTLTGTHQVMGTPRYMAPEQMEGSRTVDHRADVYSLGVVFYEMLTGEVPMGQFEPPSKKAPVDVRLDDIVLQAMAREPDRRFQSANDMLHGISKVADSYSAGPANAQLPGPSTILDIGVQRAVAGIKRGINGESGIPPIVTGLIGLLLCVAGVGTHVMLFGMKSARVSGSYGIGDIEICIIVAGILLFALTLLMLGFGLTRKLSLWRPLSILPVAIAAIVLDLIFLLNDVKWSEASQFRNVSITAFVVSVGLLLAGVWDLRNYFDHRSRQPKKPRQRKSVPESAHVGFAVPGHKSPVPYVAPHFQMLGYQLVDQSANEWIFERGSKTGHMGMDLRKCFTVLTVRTGPRPDGGQWVSCGWAVQAYVSGGEITKLEEEGQSFARAIGVDSVTLTKAESKQVGRSQTLVSVLGGSSRTGNWKPPTRLNVFGLLGGCDLDFRKADLAPGVNVVNVVAIMGAIEIIVPPNVPVEVSGMGLLGAFEQEGSDQTVPAPVDGPSLKITGVAILGAVSVETKSA